MENSIALSPAAVLREKLASRLRKKSFIIGAIRFATALKYLGPWRNIVVGINSRIFSNPDIHEYNDSLFTSLNTGQVLNEVRSKGFCRGFKLPETIMAALVHSHAQDDYRYNSHKSCPHMKRLVYDPALLEIARKYLKSEPRVYLSRIYESCPEEGDDVKREFHYDVGDYRSISIFFYLCDVGKENCPHYYIKGSHKATSFKKLAQRFISHEDAEQRYGQNIKLFTGKKGDGFIEDLTGYHKRSYGSKSRLALSITYTAMRKPQAII